MMEHSVRAPAVAGSFYPASATALGKLVDDLLAGARVTGARACPKALIVPHAGYVYSGPIAASAFALLAGYADRLDRVVLVGPAHRVFVHGLVSPGASRMSTPIGEIAVDVDALRRLPQVTPNIAAHAREHSLEVEFPFLQRVAPRAQLVPLAVSNARPDEVGHVLETVWGGSETLIVISSDLSHYLPYGAGRALDQRTAQLIVAIEPELTGDQACGAAGINGLLWVARRKRMCVELVDLRSSGDTAGSRDEVVGYGAFALYEVA